MSYYLPAPGSVLPRPDMPAFPRRWVHHRELLAVVERDNNAAAERQRQNRGLPPALTVPTARQRPSEGKCQFCVAECIPESLYCDKHTCQARNADGERCPNAVALREAFCAHGYHIDNQRHHYVEHAHRVRQVYFRLEENDRAMEHLEHLEYFSSYFPGIAFQPSMDASWSSVESSPSATLTSPPISMSSSLSALQDKWDRAHRPRPMYEIPACASLLRPTRRLASLTNSVGPPRQLRRQRTNKTSL